MVYSGNKERTDCTTTSEQVHAHGKSATRLLVIIRQYLIYAEQRQRLIGFLVDESAGS